MCILNPGVPYRNFNWKIKAKSNEVILDTATLTEQTKLSGYAGL